MVVAYYVDRRTTRFATAQTFRMEHQSISRLYPIVVRRDHHLSSSSSSRPLLWAKENQHVKAGIQEHEDKHSI